MGGDIAGQLIIFVTHFMLYYLYIMLFLTSIVSSGLVVHYNLWPVENYNLGIHEQVLSGVWLKDVTVMLTLTQKMSYVTSHVCCVGWLNSCISKFNGFCILKLNFN